MTFSPLLCLAVLGAGAAFAEPPPNLLPTRDVAVDYQLAAPGRPVAAYELVYDAARLRARVNDPAHGTYFLVDLGQGRAELVIPMLHTIIEAPDLSAISDEITRLRGARLTRLGTGQYAGRTCRKYLIIDTQGSGDACLTPDGVALSFDGRDAHGAASVTATSVTYQAALPDEFAAPAGFGEVTLPPGALNQLLRQQ